MPSLVPARVRDALRVVARFSSLPSRVIPFTCGRAGWGVGRLGGLGVGDWAGGKDGSASDTSESKKQNERRFPACALIPGVLPPMPLTWLCLRAAQLSSAASRHGLEKKKHRTHAAAAMRPRRRDGERETERENREETGLNA